MTTPNQPSSGTQFDANTGWKVVDGEVLPAYNLVNKPIYPTRERTNIPVNFIPSGTPDIDDQPTLPFAEAEPGRTTESIPPTGRHPQASEASSNPYALDPNTIELGHKGMAGIFTQLDALEPTGPKAIIRRANRLDEQRRNTTE